MRTTAGQILLNEVLPEDLRDYRRVLDKKGLKELLREVYERHPDQYKEIVHRLADVGSKAVYRSGHSLSIAAMKAPIGKRAIINKMMQAVGGVLRDPTIDDEQRREQIAKVVQPFKDQLVALSMEDGIGLGNPLALQVASGSRGNEAGLNSLRGADLLYEDARNRVIPIPVVRSYSEGLDPAEYWAGAYGARKGMKDVKMATQKAGFFGKQVAQAAHRLVVTEPDCGTELGIPVRANDPDNMGALLAKDAGDFSRDTPLSARELKRLGDKSILIRSPITCQARDGVCARCAGIRDRGKLPDIGDHVGISAVQSLSERLSQGQLCLAEGTRVRMADWTVKRIEDIRVGDMVLGADSSGNTFPVVVLKVFNNGKRRCQKITFKVGLQRKTVSMIATTDHKMLCVVNKWQCSGQAMNGIPHVREVGFKTKDFSAIRPEGFISTGMTAEPYALAIGLMLGDGYCKRRSGAMLFSCADDTLIEEVNPLLYGLNLKIRRRKHPLECVIKALADDLYTLRGHDGRMRAGYRNPLKVRLDRYGILGCGAESKQLPPSVYDWDNNSVAMLLSGLFVTDGCVMVAKDQKKRSKPYISYTSTSKRMVDQVRELLGWRFGIYPTFGATSSGRKRTLYSLSIATHDGVRKFYGRIPLFGKKRRLLDELMGAWRVEKPMRYFRMKRCKMEDAGRVQTYDLEVGHPDHLFVLENGLIVSNSSKHAGGVVGTGQAVSGFELINQLVQVPKVFKGGAAIAELDGRVTEIKPAPQGGTYIRINDRSHYVPEGLNATVKVGGSVEAGDVLSQGIPNPAKIVKYKGIGAGRMYFADQFTNAFRDSGLNANRRNVEFVARSLINHVRVLDEDVGEDTVPDDLAEYDAVSRKYTPRVGHQVVPLPLAKGKFLEQPVLHYSIGTRLTPSVLKVMKQHDVGKVVVHDDEPGFVPEMHRAMENLTVTPDWQTRLSGFYLGKGLRTAVHRGAVSTTEGVSFVPRVAQGKPLFGGEKQVKVSPVL